MTQNTTVSAGELVRLTYGIYSDFGVVADLIARRDFDVKAALQSYKQNHKPKNENDEPDERGFAAFLCINHYTVEAASREIHVGSFGDLDID